MREIVSPLSGFASPFGRGADPYAILGYKPPLVLDYENSKFRVSGSTSTAPSVVTATRTGLATQLDASGNLVWNAHNLLLRSEEFDNASWAKLNITSASPTISTNQGVAPDGTTTADLVTFGPIDAAGDLSIIRQLSGVQSNIQQTGVVYIKAATEGDIGKRLYVYVNDISAINAFTPVVLTDEWQEISVTGTFGGNSRYLSIATSGSGAFDGLGSSADSDAAVLLWGAHLYRSDLGGMAPVPLTRRVAGSTTYVPTTSAAVYLPREEAYAYVSGALVGPYYQKESDARTNLVTYSEDFTDASWTKVNAGVGSVPVVTANQGISPSGETTADRVQFDLNGGTTAGDVSRLRFSSTTVAASTGSFWVKSFDGTPYTIGFNVGSTLIAVSVTSEWQRVNATFSSSGATAVDIQLRGAQTPTNSGTADILLWGAQHEEGSTPASYIPTSGSTVTRPADSTTIAAGNMPYPTPQVIGPELVTNGTFDTDVSGWTATRSASLALVSNTIEVTGTGTMQSAASQGITTTIGETYVVSFDLVSETGTARFAVSSQDNLNTAPDILNNLSLSAGQSYTFTFKANATTTYLHLASAGATDVTSWDNVSVREINPLALSFQLEGLVTYADDNLTEQVQFAEWEASNAVNDLLVYLGTDGATEGTMRFRQWASGTSDIVAEAAPGSYSPGINVPFNIASRHGSTFINGAVDGTALTADTTPTALPDLSATTFNLAPTFNGFIKEFRVWADDIGDSGIAEAST